MSVLTSGVRSAAEAAVRDRSNASLIAVLRRVLDDPIARRMAAARSHRHQLGFEKYVLDVDRKGRSLRLHSWDAAASEVREDVHSHCAGFTSRIVTGSFVERQFVVEAGDELSVFRYQAGVDGRQAATHTGSCRLRQIGDSTVRRPGDIYTRRANDLHHVYDAEPGTLSISVWEPRLANALVMKDRNATASDCLAPAGMRETELSERLISIEQRLTEL